ncbi:hypothetical protein [Nocardioides marmoraquaticus]
MSALSPEQMFRLDLACRPLNEWFGIHASYLVGTAQQPRDGRPPRDVDVRALLEDVDYDRLAAALPDDGALNLLQIGISSYLRDVTGLPVDFQVQRLTQANERHQGTRNPLGLATRWRLGHDGRPDADS